MGERYGAICKECGHHFSVDEGGGFFFHLLHCNKCGKDKDVGFDELGVAHLQYLKGLPGPYAVATAEFDRKVKENLSEPAISEAEYHKIVESTAGKCKCGGQFKMKARPRCPKCRSTKFDRDPEGGIMCYD